MVDAQSLFVSRFGQEPSLALRSPGRINIIGDHTDYCGLPVLPMAIEQAIQLAGRQSSEPGVRAVSTLDDTAVDSAGPGHRTGWAKYVLAVHDELVSRGAEGLGAELALDGDLPSTGGLSSSSALTIGCIAALNRLWDLELKPEQHVEIALDAERNAAVAGGAMDQTVIAHARPGHALRIDFDPPSLHHIPVPSTFHWVAGYSGDTAAKGAAAADSYNSFVLASRAATALLAKRLGRPYDPGMQLSSVRDAPDDHVANLPTVTAQEAAELTGGERLGLSTDHLLDLRISAEHVLSEATRVDEAAQALIDGDAETMGRLMNDSHASLGRYGSTTDNLDRLVGAARAAGAAGARVTGAGFGGWAVALTDERRVGGVVDAMKAACGGPALEVAASGGALVSLDD